MVFFFQDGLTLEESRTVQILPTQLRISNLRQSDIGDYTCKAQNRQGTITAKTNVIVAGMK